MLPSSLKVAVTDLVSASLWLTLVSLTVARELAPMQVPHDYDSDSDLASYVTRPDIRPPLLDVRDIARTANSSPGYWFITPYEEPEIQRASKQWGPEQIGPHIYDNQGELVWSGAQLFPSGVAHDLRTTRYSTGAGQIGLSFILGNGAADYGYPMGARVVLDSSYEVHSLMNSTDQLADMHEFLTVEDGRRALYIMHTSIQMEIDIPERAISFNGTILTSGFREVDLESGDVMFEWFASNHTDPGESSNAPLVSNVVQFWDNVHINSVDKTADGNYLISARHTDTIYKISSSDGTILWRLGGQVSSFQLNGFNFSKQHDARILHEDEKTTILSFLNNAADEYNCTSEVSSAMIVSLDHSTTPKTATLLRSFERPDGGLSRFRGNVQKLSNGNILVGWSENGYATEFTDQGEVVQEVSFASHRFVNYRTYKLDWIGHPRDPPAARSYAFGDSYSAMTVVYASWNGATQVASWKFWGSCSNASSATFSLLGQEPRSGFETTYQTHGMYAYCYAEALSKNGSSLGLSPVGSTELHRGTTLSLCSDSSQRIVTIPIKHARRLILRDELQASLNVVIFTAFAVVCALVVRRRFWAQIYTSRQLRLRGEIFNK